jgi:hypothetical protein
MMEQFPEAGYGLCTIPQDDDQMFPYSLSPTDAYISHYIKNSGIFLRAPLSAIIKKEAFVSVNGFANSRMVGDYELWHKLSLSFNVVLMPQGIIWYRRHAGQEMKSHAKFLMKYLEISEHYIKISSLPDLIKFKLDCKINRHKFVKVIKNPMNFSLVKRLQYLTNGNVNLLNLSKAIGNINIK